MTFETKPTEKNQYTNTIHFETVINKAFTNYKKIALYAGLALFVFFFMLILVISAISANVIGAENINEKSMEQFSKLLMTKPYLWYYTGFSIVLGSMLTPFMAGFYKMADSAEKDISFGIADLFSFYSSKYFFPLFGATFIIGVVTNGLSLLSEELNIASLGLLLVIIINFITLLTVPLIIFGNEGAFSSIKTSSIITLKQAWVIFLLVFIALIGVLLGLFAFCIGIIFTYPFFVSMIYSIYNQMASSKNSNTES